MKIHKLGVAILAGWVGAASAEVLVDYQFNDAVGTGLSSVFNAGSDSGNFVDAAGFATDGLGFLSATSNANNLQSYDLDSAIMSGTVTAAWTIASFDLSGNTTDLTDDTFGVLLGDGTKLRLGLRYNAGEVQIRQSMSGYNRNDTIIGAGFTATNAALNLEIMIDLDTNWIQSRWQWDGDASWTTVAASSTKDYLTNGVTGVVMEFETGDWGATDYINADSFTLTASIPEPATLGLVLAMLGGILFIRRRFMI